MGRKRKTGKGLPRRVYLRSGTYWYVQQSGKWIKLGRSKSEMYAGLSQIHGEQLDRMSAVFDRYRKDVLPNKAASTQATQSIQLKNLQDIFGKMRPASIRKSDIAGFLDRYPSPINANRHIALLSHVFRKAIRWGLLESNPCIGVERNKERPRTRYVTDAEFWAVWEMASEPMRLLMELALCTGQRQGDLIRLKWSDVTAKGVEFTQGKTGKKLIVRHNKTLDALLRRCQALSDGPFVIGKANGAAYTSSGVQSAWRRYMDQHKGKRFTFHDIRAKSASDHETGEHLGHETEAILKRVYRRTAKVVDGLHMNQTGAKDDEE